jgi:hypothetical protein
VYSIIHVMGKHPRDRIEICMQLLKRLNQQKSLLYATETQNVPRITTCLSARI